VKLLWVGLGGAAGSVARYLLESLVQRSTGTSFPLGTLAVNVVGSLGMGIAMHVAIAAGAVHSTARIAVTAGLLGGFTTYSAFNQDVLEYLRRGEWATGGAYVGATVFACLAAGAIGVVLTRAALAT